MGRTIKRFGILISFVVFTACSGATPEDAIGSWEYERGPRKSCIEVLPEGKYKHTIYHAGAIESRSESKWTIDKMSDGRRVITFEKFTHLADDGESVKSPGFWPVVPSRPLFARELQLRLSDDEELFYGRRGISCAPK